MPELHRITTEYIDTEDRIRLIGEVNESDSVILWLTQRLLTRLLPHLFLWLEQQNGNTMPAEIVQSFAQRAARSELAEQPPVQRSEDSTEWLVHAVDITPDNASLRMRFRSIGEDEATLTLPVVQLRQWLGIVHLLWHNGEWQAGIWPEWISADELKNARASQISIH
ncbi:MAG: hypothetical protein WBJ75_03305 [Pseudohongiellaceae bacterium]